MSTQPTWALTAICLASTTLGCSKQDSSQTATAKQAELRPAATAPTAFPPSHTASGKPPAAATAPGPSKTSHQAGGLNWEAPAPFEAQAPKSSMRAAEYSVTGAGDTTAILAVFYFPGGGGGLQENIDRWVGQFKQADGSPSKDAARIDKRKVNGIDVTRIDVSGHYAGMARPGQPGAAPQADQRLLGAIAEGPQGLVFFKLTGPKALVTKTESAFDHVIGSLHR